MISSELEDDLTRHLDAHVRASCTRVRVCVWVWVYLYTRACVCENRVLHVPRERKRDTSGMRRGEKRRGRIDIKIVTEFRHVPQPTLTPLGSPLNYPLSSRVLSTTLPLPSPHPPRVVPRNCVPILRPFPDSSPRRVRAFRVIGPENFTSQPARRKTPS